MLSSQFVFLKHWFTGEVLRFHKLGIPRRRVIDQIEAAVDCVLANFLDAHRISPNCFVAISLGEATYKRSRYFTADFGYTNLKRVLDFFRKADPAYVIFKRGFNDARGKKAVSKVSRFAPSDRFLQLMHGYFNVIDPHLQRGKINMGEVVTEAYAFARANPLPKSRRININATVTVHQPASDIIRLKNGAGELTNFDDTEVTNGMRQRLQRWNEFITEQHHLDLLLPDGALEQLFEPNEIDEAEEDIFFSDEKDKPRFVELKRVRLHRVFNHNSFEQGGRFYGGWWQQIPSKFRRYITINEHATKEFDFSNLHAAMLYAIEGMPLVDDAYSLPNVPAQYRKLIKVTFLALINALPNQRIQRPKGKALPRGLTWTQLQEAIIERHAPIRKHLRSGVGLRLQRTDSDIAEQVMLRMMERDVLVLPVHDSFITYHELQNDVLSEMQRAYRERMNADIGIDADPSFIDKFLDVGGDGPKPADWDIVDLVQAQPGYDGYRERHREFFRTRPDHWHQRFGG